jgi:polyphosphate kinase
MAANLEDYIEGRHHLAFHPLVGAPEQRYLNRELSWLDFNARVLALADQAGTPLLERAKFLAIFSQNLDEFFQVRVAGLKDQVAAGLGRESDDGLSADEQLAAIRARVNELMAHQCRIFLEEVAPALADTGIRFSNWDELDDDDRDYLVDFFEQQIFPVLTPLAVDPGHPFPYISNLSLNLAVMVRDPDSLERRFARVKVPNLLPRFVVMPDGERYVPLEQVIAEHLNRLFAGMVIEHHHPFRVTRNADLTLEEDEADDLLSAVEVELRRRRFGRAVRLEVPSDMDPETLDLLVRELDLTDDDVYVSDAPLDLGGLWHVWELPRPDLKDEPRLSMSPPRLTAPDDEPVDIFARIRAGDILLHHPYESFTKSVEAFVRQAAADPKVLAIKQTLYRTSSDSPIIQALEEAAENGKEVTVLVELKARFDESQNVQWAKRLEDAGCLVIYGVVGLKTHAKALLVIRRQEGRIRRYVHLATGNYNDKTAKLYSDLGMFSCDSKLATDVAGLFNLLTGVSESVGWSTLTIAPLNLKKRFIEMIDREIKASSKDRPGLIMAKINSLEDQDICRALYRAGRKGVRILLNVRGICCLKPGIKGVSENIEVVSILDRYLEHARIFYFANGGHPEVYLSSADWMERNLDKRIELLFPVTDAAHKKRCKAILDTCFADNTQSWTLQSDGTYVPKTGSGKKVQAQRVFYEQVLAAHQKKKQHPQRFHPVRQHQKV